MKSEIARYLDDYDPTKNREIVPEKKSYPNLRNPSCQEVADMLAGLNIRDVKFPNESREEIDEDVSKTFRQSDINKSMHVSKSQDIGTETYSKNPQNSFLQDCQKFKDIAESKEMGTEIQNFAMKREKNEEKNKIDERTFLKLGLDVSKAQIPDRFFKQILKSEYLRTDPNLNL